MARRRYTPEETLEREHARQAYRAFDADHFDCEMRAILESGLAAGFGPFSAYGFAVRIMTDKAVAFVSIPADQRRLPENAEARS